MIAEKERPVSGFGSKVSRRQFHTFDALRFLAFFKVFLLHIPIAGSSWFLFIKAGGGIGVQFFFVLSGFLITYIILEEKVQKGTLNLKNFFVRRMLRIWPLYYLMVGVAYATPYILSHVLHISSSAEGYEPKLWVSLLFLENYQMMITHQHANVSPLSVMWSLCIEEHFYIVWGLLLFYCKAKHLPTIIGIAIALAPICRVIYVSNDIPTSDIFTNIDLFAYGALPAYMLVTRGSRLEDYIMTIRPLYKWSWVSATIAAVLLLSQLKTDEEYIAATSVLGILFSGILFIILPVKSRLKIADKSIITKLGLYTYGLYMYHTLVINLLRQLYLRWGYNIDEPSWSIPFFIASLIVTIILAILSYHIFEKPFLRLKKKFI